MVAQILNHMELLDPSKLTKLRVQIFIEAKEVLLGLFRWCLRLGILPQMLNQQGGGEGRLVMQSGASIGMPAGTYLEVEGTIHLILFRSVDSSQVLSHAYKVCEMKERMKN